MADFAAFLGVGDGVQWDKPAQKPFGTAATKSATYGPFAGVSSIVGCLDSHQQGLQGLGRACQQAWNHRIWHPHHCPDTR
jgi:hypothetical protein